MVKYGFIQWKRGWYRVDSVMSLESSEKTFEIGDTDLPTRAIESEKPRKTFFDYLEASAGTLLMMASSSQIIYSFLCMPETLSSSYYGFLVTHSGVKDKMGPLASHQLRLLGRLMWKLNGKPEHADKFIPLLKFDRTPQLPSHVEVPHAYAPSPPLDGVAPAMSMCNLIHPDQVGCGKFALVCFARAMLRSVKLYLPLNVAMTLIFGFKRLKAQPMRAILRLILSTARSTVFLAGFVTTSWSFTCLIRQWFQREFLWPYILNGAMSGAWALIENPSRRVELALYCLPRALESLWRTIQALGYLPASPRSRAAAQQLPWYHRVLVDKRIGEPMYFMLAMGSLMMLFETESWVISPGYRTVMTRFFGVN